MTCWTGRLLTFFLVAIGWVIMSQGSLTQINHHWFTTVFSMVTMWAALSGVEHPRWVRWPLLAGLMAGAAAMITPTRGALVMLGLFAGLVAFPTTAFFLAWSFQDDVSLVGAVGALLVMLGATILIFSAFVVPLAVGSTMLTSRLARIGVVPRLVPVVQATTAILFTVGLSVGLGSEQGITSRAVFAVLFTPYLLTWCAIGVSLIRGVPQTQARSG
jgi:hypothetical protein